MLIVLMNSQLPRGRDSVCIDIKGVYAVGYWFFNAGFIFTYVGKVVVIISIRIVLVLNIVAVW